MKRRPAELASRIAAARVATEIDRLRLRWYAAKLRCDRLRQEARRAAYESDEAWRRAVDLYAGSLATVRATEKEYRRAVQDKEVPGAALDSGGGAG